MPISGDALAAKLAELVGYHGCTPDEWERGAINPDPLLCDLLAWVAEQGAAGVFAPAEERDVTTYREEAQ